MANFWSNGQPCHQQVSGEPQKIANKENDQDGANPYTCASARAQRP